MSMFFIVKCEGSYDAKSDFWDDGITFYEEPAHVTKDDISLNLTLNPSWHKPILDKSACPEVQELYKQKESGNRFLTLLVKAKGYGQAEEKAKRFCDYWYKPRLTPQNKRITAKEYFSSSKIETVYA